MVELAKKIGQNINAETIALFSIFISFLIYLLSKKSELKLKKHELKKDKYLEFISLLKEVYISGGNIKLDNKTKLKFFDIGSTLFIYGSKKMYKKYCLFREISSETIKKTKYYDQELSLFLVADLLNQIRKEIGMYDFELSLKYKSIAFFTNDIYNNPNLGNRWLKCKIKINLIKFELFLYKLVELTLCKKIFLVLLFPLQILCLLIKYILMIPVGKILIKLGVDKKLNLINNNR